MPGAPGKNAPKDFRAEGAKPKKPPRWRDLTDEQRWEQIYKGREQKRALAPKSAAQAAALALPAYVLHMAVTDCQQTFQATIRHDVHTAIVSTVARVASLLQAEKDRAEMLERLTTYYGRIRSRGFYIDNREFLYANAAALVKLVDDYRYPPDAPVVMAAIMLKDDAETDEEGDWRLSKAHAIQMTGVAYDEYLNTELYAYPTADSAAFLH